MCVCVCVCFDDFFFFFFFLIWVLCLFQEYFTIVHQRRAKTRVPGEHGFPTCVSDPSKTRTPAVRNDQILVSVYIINILYAYVRGGRVVRRCCVSYITGASS